MIPVVVWEHLSSHELQVMRRKERSGSREWKVWTQWKLDFRQGTKECMGKEEGAEKALVRVRELKVGYVGLLA